MKLEHPDGGTVETTADGAAAYLSQGWVKVVEAPAKPAGRKGGK